MIRFSSFRNLAILAVAAYAVALLIMIGQGNFLPTPRPDVPPRIEDQEIPSVERPVQVQVRSTADLQKIRDLTGDADVLMLYECTDDDLALLSREGNVVHVQVTSNSVTNQGLMHLRELPRLNGVTLSGVKIGDDLEALTECRELVSIGIYGFEITEKLIDVLARIPKLRAMAFDERDLSVAPSKIVERIPNLERFTIKTKVFYNGPYSNEIHTLSGNDRLHVTILD